MSVAGRADLLATPPGHLEEEEEEKEDDKEDDGSLAACSEKQAEPGLEPPQLQLSTRPPGPVHWAPLAPRLL